MSDVFISYSQRLPEPTVAVADELTKRGFRPWYDVNLLPGQFFGTVIKDNIDRAQAVVTIWSEPALTSQWVPAEAQMALDQKKLICVRTPDLDTRRLPPPFNTMHTPPWEDLNGLFQALIGMGVRPTGAGAGTDLEALTAAAARDWRTMPAGDREALEAFLEEYGQLAMYRRMAQKRLDAMGPASAAVRQVPLALVPVVLPEAPPARAEDVILRLDAGMHTAMIRRISVSAEGRLMATACDDKTVKLWSLPEGRLIRTLRPPIGSGNEGKVYAVALGPAGRWVAAGGWMNTGDYGHFVTIFDAEGGRLLRRLGPLPNAVVELKVSPDGTRLAAGLGGANGVRVWETRDWSLAFEDRDYSDYCLGLGFAGDGRLAAASYDGDVRLYDPAGRRMARAKAPGGERPYGVAFAPDEDLLAVGYYDRLGVDVLDGSRLQRVAEADTAGLSRGNFASVAFLGDGRLVAGGTHQQLERGVWRSPILVWADGGRGARNVWPGPENTVLDLAPLPKSSRVAPGGLAFGAADPAFGLIEADGQSMVVRGPPMADLRERTGEHFTVSADGRLMRFGLKPLSNSPVLFDFAARRLSDAPVPRADLLQPETKGLPIEAWENGYAPKLHGRDLPLEPYECARSLAIAPDANSFVLGTEWSLRRVDAKGTELWRQAVPAVAWGVNLACEGRLILAAYGDGTIRWHRASDGAELLALFIHLPEGPEGPRDWILFTPEGYFEASSPEAEKLIGWHVNRGPDEAADFFPVDTYASTFRRPDKIDAALALA